VDDISNDGTPAALDLWGWHVAEGEAWGDSVKEGCETPQDVICALDCCNLDVLWAALVRHRETIPSRPALVWVCRHENFTWLWRQDCSSPFMRRSQMRRARDERRSGCSGWPRDRKPQEVCVCAVKDCRITPIVSYPVLSGMDLLGRGGRKVWLDRPVHECRESVLKLRTCHVAVRHACTQGGVLTSCYTVCVLPSTLLACSMRNSIWYPTFGVPHLVSHIWCPTFGIPHLVSHIWYPTFGIPRLVSHIWYPTFGVPPRP
jgi:hypothetical protein